MSSSLIFPEALWLRVFSRGAHNVLSPDFSLGSARVRFYI
jgi:hypothetical protein